MSGKNIGIIIGIIVIVLILIGLIWWFMSRKPSVTEAVRNGASPRPQSTHVLGQTQSSPKQEPADFVHLYGSANNVHKRRVTNVDTF